VVDPERLHRLLRRITDDLAVLDGYVPAAREDLLRDPVRLGHLKYTFVTLLEGCLDAAHHVAAAQGYGPADTNAAAMRLLARHGVLPDELGSRMARAVGFRNVLVHGYAVVDDRKVVAYLDHLDDVRTFVRLLAELITD
jgi:uncharacterized protein YutE (UPF0331/DUF86 family)